MDHLCYFCLVLLCFHARLFVDALWSPAGKGLTSWLSFVMSNCDIVTFSLVSWVRCYGKIPLNIFLSRIRRNLRTCYVALECAAYQVCSFDDLRLPLTIKFSF